MRQEIIKIHREALQYIDEYTGGKVTNKTVRVYMDSNISNLSVREQIQRVINVLEEQNGMTHKEELQAEKLKLEERVSSLRFYKMRWNMSIEIIKRGRIMLGKEPISEENLKLLEKTDSEIAELNQKIQKLEAKINIL